MPGVQGLAGFLLRLMGRPVKSYDTGKDADNIPVAYILKSYGSGTYTCNARRLAQQYLPQFQHIGEPFIGLMHEDSYHRDPRPN